MMTTTELFAGDALTLQLRFQREDPSGGRFHSETRNETWQPSETAIIVCDAWDFHHCLNAVRRLGEFAPRLDKVLATAREQGVTIIHAPSDCMDAYQNHPGRKRAMTTPTAAYLPHDISSWCSIIPAEEQSVYPIDQSDGGEDDDPKEHAEWAAELKSMGRNPGNPWQQQTELITIAPKSDFISDQGDEIWNVLQHKGIRNVILTGVHTNMCVLGRPFGLRQLARNGKNVVLMRDMTDTMYNPERWPYVSHFEGTRRVISHVERFVCPTVTSDQIIGGQPFRFAGDLGEAESAAQENADPRFRRHWSTVSVPHSDDAAIGHEKGDANWYRCVVRIPGDWAETARLVLPSAGQHAQAWLNGKSLQPANEANSGFAFDLPADSIETDDANLLVVRLEDDSRDVRLLDAPTLHARESRMSLAGRWQFRVGNEVEYASIPLPAKFGGSADVVFTSEDPLWTPRAITRRGDFTSGIEGPACDDQGNLFAVNFGHQGTIGKIRGDGTGEIFVELPKGSIGNGIRFAPDGSFFVADYTGHNILRVDPQTRQISVHAHSDQMNQPNDLAISPDGKTLYASDPNWSDGTGQLWRIDEDGSVTRLADGMGTTNGIEVSPDGKTLYVNESKQRNVWAFTLTDDRTLSEKRLLRKFDDHGFDGMRCDVDGNLYITRHGKGTVVKLSPGGDLLREIPVLGSKPSNLSFGGPDRRTIYVTEVDSTRIVRFRVDRPGRE